MPTEIIDPREVYAAMEAALGAPLADAQAVVSGLSNTVLANALLSVVRAAPSPLRAGVLRPPVIARGGFQGGVGQALKLLLYAPEVLMEPPSSISASWAEMFTAVANDLELVRGLVELGAVHFGALSGRPHWDGGSLNTGGFLLGMMARRDTRWGERWEDYAHMRMQASLLSAWAGAFTLWFRHEEERLMLERAAAVCGHQAGVELAADADRRVLQLPKLAQIELPAVELSAADLISARRNDAVFAEWREQLGRALAQVEHLPDSEGWQREARAIITDELTPYTERLRREVKQSSSMSAAVNGMRTLAIVGIGGAVGVTAQVGRPEAALGALGGTAVASVASGLSDWLKARRAAEPRRAVLQLAMVFDPSA